MGYDKLIVGQKYTNEEVRIAFSCSTQGGMRVSIANKSITLISNHFQKNDKVNPYKDDPVSLDDVFLYTGMGLSGEQKLSGNNANTKLANSKTNGYRIFLFEVFKSNEYTYRGEVILVDKPKFYNEADVGSKQRFVIKFPLRLKELSDVQTIDESVIEKEEEKRDAYAKRLDNHELAIAAAKASERQECIESKEIISKAYIRNSYVKVYTLKRALGHCDLCGCQAPFIKKDGTAYLESHHLIPLSENGIDAIFNTVALCPNCHRKMHELKNKADFKRLEDKIGSYLEKDNNLSYEETMKLIDEYKKNFGIK